MLENDCFGENNELHHWIGVATLHPVSTDQRSRTTVEVRRLEAADADDAGLVDHLTRLVNDVYATAERGLWRDGWTRTTTSELAGLIAAGEIAVASRHGEVSGSVRIHDVAADTSEFGMLVAAPEHRNSGVGRALLDFAERESRERGLRAIELELLVPRTWSHPSKEFLKAWYGRRGYRLIGSREHRRGPSAPGAAARHPVRGHRLREAPRPRSETAMSKVVRAHDLLGGGEPAAEIAGPRVGALVASDRGPHGMHALRRPVELQRVAEQPAILGKRRVQ